jgi:hypothetical protein
MWNWLRKLFKRKKVVIKEVTLLHPITTVTSVPQEESTCSKVTQWTLTSTSTKPEPRFKEYKIPEIPVKAVRQDVSQFMKHGKQSKQYRKTVKQHKQPNEDD